MLTQINQANDIVAATIPLALPVIEAVIRFIPSQKPLSLFHMLAECLHGLGNLASTIAGGLDSVVPQKIAQPKASDTSAGQE